MEPVRRVAARVVLLDPDGASLLIRSHDPDVVDGPTWWHVPGGGLDPGETPQQAAIREIYEETGLRLADVGPCVGTRTTFFTFLGAAYRQEESFYVVRLPERIEIDDTSWEEVERRATLGWRWWTVDELRVTTETVYPRGLPDLISGWLTAGPPAEPILIP